MTIAQQERGLLGIKQDRGKPGSEGLRHQALQCCHGLRSSWEGNLQHILSQQHRWERRVLPEPAPFRDSAERDALPIKA